MAVKAGSHAFSKSWTNICIQFEITLKKFIFEKNYIQNIMIDLILMKIILFFW